VSTISDPTAVEFRAAVRDALDEELARDENVILFGEDGCLHGGTVRGSAYGAPLVHAAVTVAVGWETHHRSPSGFHSGKP